MLIDNDKNVLMLIKFDRLTVKCFKNLNAHNDENTKESK